MLALSDLQRYSLPAASGVPGARAGRLLDLAYALTDADYPAITHCLVKLHGQPPGALPWPARARLDRRARQLRLPDDNKREPVDPAKLDPGLVWLGRDVLDGLILDLGQRRVTRANDLWLEESGGCLQLCAADTGLRAVARRLTGGRVGGSQPSTHLDWKYVEFLRGNPEAVRAGAGYHRRIVRLPAGEIASLAQALPYLHVAELLALLPAKLAADTLQRLPPEQQLQAFEELEDSYALEVLVCLAPDVAADLVGQLTTSRARRLLNTLPEKASQRIVELLRYPEDSVGGIMTNDLVTTTGDLTAARARKTLREALRGPAFVHFIYVLEDNDSRKLRGVISLRDLMVADDDQRLETLMNPYLLTLSPLEPARHAAHRLLNSQLAALPVVGDAGQLLGAVTVDMALSQVTPPHQPSARVFA